MISFERRFLPILAAVGGIILLHQGLDLLSVTDGADLTTPAGRMGLAAILWTRGAALLAADGFLIIAAVRSSWARLTTALAMVHLVCGVAALFEIPFFLVDAAHLVDSIAIPELTSFRITVVRILAALTVLGVGALVAGVSLVPAGTARSAAA